MFERREVLSGGRKVDRQWWLATKLTALMVVMVIAGYFTAMALVA